MKKNKLWRVLTFALTLVMMLSLLAACQPAEEQTSPSPSPSPSPDGTTSFNPDKLEEKTDVEIVRNATTEEETTETKQGKKSVSQPHGYAIYILDGFTFTSGDEFDTITMNDDPNVKMTIRQVTKEETQAASGYDEATEIVTVVERKLFDDRSKLIEFAMIFPISELEGKARFLYAMKDSVRNGN